MHLKAEFNNNKKTEFGCVTGSSSLTVIVSVHWCNTLTVTVF